MEEAGNLIWTLIVVAAVTLLLSLVSARRRAGAWEGNVVDIRRTQRNKGGGAGGRKRFDSRKPCSQGQNRQEG